MGRAGALDARLRVARDGPERSEYAALMRPAGANTVITSSEVVGRLLDLSAISPHLGVTIQELLSTREGLDLNERPVTAEEVGRKWRIVDAVIGRVINAAR